MPTGEQVYQKGQMYKKGQVTVFIIIGILVLAVTMGTLLLVEKVQKESLTTERQTLAEGYEFSSVQQFMDDCLERTAIEAVQQIGFHGGYYQVPVPALNYLLIRIPYYFDLGQKHFPTQEQIAEEMGKYIEDNLNQCLHDFTVFKNRGMNIVEGEKKATVALGSRVTVTLDYSLEIQEGSSVKQLEQFRVTLPLDFEQVYSLVSQTVEEQEKNLNFVPIGYLSTLAKENKFRFELSYLDDDVVVYSFIFEQQSLKQKPYRFVFAERYDWAELAPPTGTAELDYVQEVQDQYCYVGDSCYYNLNIYNDPYLFEDYTDLFDISPEGRIQFIPQQQEVGEHSILVKISTQEGAGNEEKEEQYVSFNLEIRALNNPPTIGKMGAMVATVSQPFSYKVEATDPDGDQLTFSDDTDIFDIQADGTIGFTLVAATSGFHIIEITVSDGTLEDKGWLYLTIKDE